MRRFVLTGISVALVVLVGYRLDWGWVRTAAISLVPIVYFAQVSPLD